MPIRAAPLDEIAPRTLYGILKLRSEVFVVEQACPYLDLDGQDAAPGALLLWAEDDATGNILATLRLLEDPGGSRQIGRVATAPEARSRGLAADLVREALRIARPGEVLLNAQTHLAGWYETLGFTVDGEAFDDDGILHTPMRHAG